MYVLFIEGNYGVLIFGKSALETSLSTMNDSIDLLGNEIAKEEALLARETKQLQEMEKNAKRAETERRRQMKNVCWQQWSISGTTTDKT